MYKRQGQTDQWASKLFNVKGRYNDPSLKGAWRSAIIAICDAVERFSETKTGALIVLERHTNLSEIVRTGTPVNSAVNLEVLGTICLLYTSHAVMDAVLGAAALGDIGQHFPDNDPAYSGADKMCIRDRSGRDL